jgi:hypothetical protein
MFSIFLDFFCKECEFSHSVLGDTSFYRLPAFVEYSSNTLNSSDFENPKKNISIDNSLNISYDLLPNIEYSPSSVFKFDDLLLEKSPFNCCNCSEISINKNRKENQLSNLPTPESLEIPPTNISSLSLHEKNSALPIEKLLNSFTYTPDLRKEVSFCQDRISPVGDIIPTSFSSIKSVMPTVPFLPLRIISPLEQKSLKDDAYVDSSSIPNDNPSLCLETKAAAITSSSSSSFISSEESLMFLMARSISAVIPMNRRNSFSAVSNNADKHRSFSTPVSGYDSYSPSPSFYCAPYMFLADGKSGTLNYLSCGSLNSQPFLLNNLNSQPKNNVKEDGYNNSMELVRRRRNTLSSLNSSKSNALKDMTDGKSDTLTTRDFLCENLKREVLSAEEISFSPSVNSMFIIII